MDTYLILGASNFLGIGLTKFLLKRGHRVVLCSRSPISLKHKFLVNVVSKLNNFDDLIFLIRAYSITEAIYLINTSKAHRNNNFCMLENMEFNIKVMNFLFKYLSRVIYFSSGGRVYGFSNKLLHEDNNLQPNCSYGREKLFLERTVVDLSQKFQKEHLIIRPSNPYGPGQDIFGSHGFISVALGKYFRRESVTLWNGGLDRRDYIYVDDFYNMFYNIIKARGLPYSTYNVGTGVGTNALEILSLIEEKTDYKFIKKFDNFSLNEVGDAVLDIKRYSKSFPDYKPLSVSSGIDKFINTVKKNFIE